MIASPTLTRIAALYDEQQRIRATLGGLWRSNDLTRLDQIATALHDLWELRRLEDCLRRAGGVPRDLGPTDGKTNRSRRIV